MPRKVKAAEPAAEWVPLSKLPPWEDNPRPADNSANVARVAASIERFGFSAPIVARKKNGMVIGGHTRLQAAETLEMKSVPVRFMDISHEDAVLLALADNRLQDLGLTDDEALARVLRALEEENLDLSIAGYSSDDLDAILGRLDPSDVEAPPLGDLPDSPSSLPGEVYALGPHRLLCGDATDEGAVATALDGKIADMVWTDPPYGIALNAQAARRGSSWAKGQRRAAATLDDTIENDVADVAALASLLEAAFSACLESCKAGGAWYVASPAMPVLDVFLGVLGPRGFNVWRHSLVWVKDTLAMGKSDYHYRHELVLYGWKPGAAHHPVADRKADSVFSAPSPARASLEGHPTAKPVELIEPMIQNSTDRGGLVLDPFGGSGATLLAAARTGRACAMVEIDPRHCDLIRRRWTAWAIEAGQDVGEGALR